MLKWRWTFILLLSATLTCASEPSVVQQLRQDLAGKEFELRIPVAGTACFQTPGLSFATTRLVDTEIGTSVQYYMRVDRFMNIRECTGPAGFVEDYQGRYLGVSQIQYMHHPGTTMTVRQIEAKEDRIELQLKDDQVKGNATYGKLKLMLGTQYSSMSLEEIERFLNSAIILPRIDAIVSTRQRYDAISGEIDQLESRLSLTNISAGQKVENVTRLLKLYEDRSDAVRRLNQVAFAPMPAPDTAALVAKGSKMLAEFKQGAAAEELSSAIRENETAFRRTKGLCDLLPSREVNTRFELEAQQAAAASTKRSLSDLQASHMRLLSLQQSSPLADQDLQEKCGAALANLSQTFEAKEAVVAATEKATAVAERLEAERQVAAAAERDRLQQLAAVDDRYRQFRRQQATIEGRLLSALGGQDEYEIYAQYRTLLESMIANRQQAQGLGSEAANGEVQGLTVRLQKLTQ